MSRRCRYAAVAGARPAVGLTLRLDGFNLFDQQASQIDYFYESRTEPLGAATADIHFHPLEPRSFRLTASKRW